MFVCACLLVYVQCECEQGVHKSQPGSCLVFIASDGCFSRALSSSVSLLLLFSPCFYSPSLNKHFQASSVMKAMVLSTGHGEEVIRADCPLMKLALAG